MNSYIFHPKSHPNPIPKPQPSFVVVVPPILLSAAAPLFNQPKAGSVEGRDRHFLGFLAGQEKYQVFTWFFTRFITRFFTRFITRFFPRFQIPGSLDFQWYMYPMHFPEILRSPSSRNPRLPVRPAASRNTRFLT